MGRSADKTILVDGHEMRMGTWHDDEETLFLEGLAKFGKDFKLLEKCIVTRTQAQIRSHYQQYAKRNGLASPEPTRKRKSEDDSTETPKKPKSGPSASKPKATPKSSVLDIPSKGTPKPSARKEHLPKVSSADKPTSGGKDLIPPSGKSTAKVAKVAKSPKRSVAPKKLNPIAKESVATIIEDDSIAGSEVSKIALFLGRDEVQTVIAGIVGFVLVYAIKKYVGE